MSTIIRVGPGGTADFIQDSASLHRASVTSSAQEPRADSLKDGQYEELQFTVLGTYTDLFLCKRQVICPTWQISGHLVEGAQITQMFVQN